MRLPLPIPWVAWLAPAVFATAMVACGDSPTDQGRAPACGPTPYFTFLPVPTEDIDFVAALGSLGAPGHTLPTAHSGFLLNRVDVPVTTPGALQVSRVRRVTYVSSPTRQGELDFAVFFSVCEDVEGWFGHLTTLTSMIPDGEGSCERYSTPTEVVESCEYEVAGVTLPAGSPLGTAGLSVERGLLGLDFGLLDARVTNAYLNPARHPDPTLHAVCPYDYFDGSNRTALLALIRNPSRPDDDSFGEPRCGTMVVDRARSAKGVWAAPDVVGPVAGDERAYLTLADDPYRPEDRLALSLGPLNLGARVALVPKELLGRVNRRFEDVPADGTLFCYTPSAETSLRMGDSWLLAVSPSDVLTIERVGLEGPAGPCGQDPDTWAFTASAVTFVR